MFGTNKQTFDTNQQTNRVLGSFLKIIQPNFYPLKYIPSIFNTPETTN